MEHLNNLQVGGKDTSPRAPLDSAVFPFRERKRKADGTVHDYETELVHRDGRVAIVCFRMTTGGGPPRLPVQVPPGSISYGYFWARRPYNLYRMLDPEGRVLAHRFDAVSEVRISAEAVEYRDLALDWWVLPDETLLEEDRDELETALAEGTLSAKDGERAEEAARQVYSRYRHIIDEAEQLQRRYVTG